MNSGRLQFFALDKTSGGFDPHAIPEPTAQIEFDVVRRDLPKLARTEGFFQMERSSQIGLVCFLGAEGRLGIVFQEKVHPC